MISNALKQASFAAAVAAVLALVWGTGTALLIWDGLTARGRRHGRGG